MPSLSLRLRRSAARPRPRWRRVLDKRLHIDRARRVCQEHGEFARHPRPVAGLKLGLTANLKARPAVQLVALTDEAIDGTTAERPRLESTRLPAKSIESAPGDYASDEWEPSPFVAALTAPM